MTTTSNGPGPVTGSSAHPPADPSPATDRAPAAAGTVRVPLRGPFSLAAAVDFVTGFGGAMTARSAPGPDALARLRLAFPVERDWRTAGAVVRQEGDVLVVTAYGPVDPAVVAAQVARILSVDVDGRGFAGVGARDPVIGGLQERFAGLRPVCFWSPYEAAAWGLIGQRISMVQAARVKGRMAAELGEGVVLDGEPVPAFPGPARLAELTGFPGLSDRKVEWLRALGAQAAEGTLDAVRLRALPRDEALRQLRELPGVGPFVAELILLRGAGDPDATPAAERRLLAAVATAYGVEAAPEALARVAEAWRPYRTWACVLLRAGAERGAV